MFFKTDRKSWQDRQIPIKHPSCCHILPLSRKVYLKCFKSFLEKKKLHPLKLKLFLNLNGHFLENWMNFWLIFEHWFLIQEFWDVLHMCCNVCTSFHPSLFTGVRKLYWKSRHDFYLKTRRRRWTLKLPSNYF